MYEQMDDEFIGEHGIRLDFVTKISSNVRKQMVYFFQKETKMQKKNNDVMRQHVVYCLQETNIYKRSSLFYWAKLFSSQRISVV